MNYVGFFLALCYNFEILHEFQLFQAYRSVGIFSVKLLAHEQSAVKCLGMHAADVTL